MTQHASNINNKEINTNHNKYTEWNMNKREEEITLPGALTSITNAKRRRERAFSCLLEQQDDNTLKNSLPKITENWRNM